MARIQKRARAAVPDVTFVTIVSAGAGTKLELLDVWLDNDGVATPRWIMLAGGKFICDRIMPAGVLVDEYQPVSALALPGESFGIITFGGGVAGAMVTLTYMEVDT